MEIIVLFVLAFLIHLPFAYSHKWWPFEIKGTVNQDDPPKKPIHVANPNKKTLHEEMAEELRKGFSSLNPFYGAPFEILPEDSKRFPRGSEMDLYRWHWKIMEDQGLLPRNWREKTVKRCADNPNFQGMRDDIQERILGLLACRQALEEWKKR